MKVIYGEVVMIGTPEEIHDLIERLEPEHPEVEIEIFTYGQNEDEDVDE